MLRLKINLRVRRSVRVKCPRHPRYNPEREGAGAIRGGCRYCQAIYELYAGKLAVEQSLQVLEQHITRCASFSAPVVRNVRADGHWLAEYFEPIEVASPNEETAVKVQQGIKGAYEKFHNVSYDNLICPGGEVIRWMVRENRQYTHDPDGERSL